MIDTNSAQQLGIGSIADYAEKVQAAEVAAKPWSECSSDEKLERVRQELLAARQQYRWEQERFGRIDEKLRHFEYHQHGTDGTVMVRARDMERGYGLVGQSLKEVFDPLA
jgi:hypothetical protein